MKHDGQIPNPIMVVAVQMMEVCRLVASGLVMFLLK